MYFFNKIEYLGHTIITAVMEFLTNLMKNCYKCKDQITLKSCKIFYEEQTILESLFLCLEESLIHYTL